ncbi:MAG: GNAT family N-acetyltransferase [bacterium]|nr:GNAT family N-acetyltransferase [bacterium]
MTTADLDRLALLQPEGWSDIVPYFRFYTSAAFCRPVKMERDGTLAAVGTAILNGATGWLAHIIVASDQRRQGFGEAVTQHLIDAVEEAGRPVQLLIATDLGKPVYERLGFTTSCEYAFHAPRQLAPAPECGWVRRLIAADRDAVLELDREATGEDRSAMLEPHLADGWATVDHHGKPNGFLLPHLAEAPVVAADPEAGRALLRLRLGLSAEKVVMPSRNEDGLAYAAELGLEAKSTAARMVRGGGDSLRHHLIYNRVGGHFG